VRDLLQRGDRQGARQLVHRLRGVAANLGATGVEALALDVEKALRSADDAALALRLSSLDAALQVVFEAAREIDAPGQIDARAAPAGAHARRDDLMALLALLQHNNLKAMAQFDALRPSLGGMLDAPALAALADAIGTLRFDAAATLVQDMLDGRTQA
jgi:HPt (histidine-containing phosphotransfer) domain-containing protein